MSPAFTTELPALLCSREVDVVVLLPIRKPMKKNYILKVMISKSIITQTSQLMKYGQNVHSQKKVEQRVCLSLSYGFFSSLKENTKKH